VVVVTPAHEPSAGMHVSTTLSTSVRDGLSLDLPATRILHVPIFLPFALVRTLTPTNAPQGDCGARPVGGLILSFAGLQGPVARMLFLNVAGVQPGWLRQTARLKVQNLPLATWQTELPSDTAPFLVVHLDQALVLRGLRCCEAGARQMGEERRRGREPEQSRKPFAARLGIEISLSVVAESR